MIKAKKRKPTHKSKLQKLNSKYLTLYKSWKKVHCPALKTDVHFTNKGWQHIQQEKWRTRSEKESRLKLLPIARNILGKTTTIQGKRLQNYKSIPHIHYQFTALLGGVVVTVVVMEDGGRYDFLSVFRVSETKK